MVTGIADESHRTQDFIIEMRTCVFALTAKDISRIDSCTMNIRLERCKKLLKWHGKKYVDRIMFSNEMLFCIKQYYNTKNDVIYSEIYEDFAVNL